MGIAYPREIETGTLGPPPSAHAPFDVVSAIERLVQTNGTRVHVAGRRLRVMELEDPNSAARFLRALLLARLRERRPDADRHTWSSFESIVHGMLRDGATLDGETVEILLRTIDGL